MFILPQRPSDQSPVPQEPQKMLRAVAILYAALMFGMLALAGVAVLLVTQESLQGEPEKNETLGRILPIVAGFLTVTTVIPAVLLGGHFVRKSLEAPGLTGVQKIQRYSSLKIVLAALIEGPGLLWGVIALVTGDLLHLFGLGFSVFALFLAFPREQEWIDATGMRVDRIAEEEGGGTERGRDRLARGDADRPGRDPGHSKEVRGPSPRRTAPGTGRGRRR